ncbi:biopolymer transporter ExbD [Nitrincola tibetensis]|uniref:Biopolymer transporter ExbD n=1 Tax=Nitrincola tibetensis TaxID=2219697 RepID=A0A364NK56_9GAMM|nr:biopolymer transporter ExbD [Nitrincola tibetensis]RAU17509.1 biopolymer transporter ExbD [Nitrincola tibetensis]
MQLNLNKGIRRKTISMTPLIDVVFILLLFFMLTSSFIKWQQMQLAVSGPSATSVATSDNPPLIARLSSDGQVSLGGENFLSNEDEALKAFIDRHEPSRILLTTDEETSIQQIVSLIDRFQRLGATNVSFNVD